MTSTTITWRDLKTLIHSFYYEPFFTRMKSDNPTTNKLYAACDGFETGICVIAATALALGMMLLMQPAHPHI